MTTLVCFVTFFVLALAVGFWAAIRYERKKQSQRQNRQLLQSLQRTYGA